MPPSPSILTLVAFLSAPGLAAFAADAIEHWPQFRGPDARGVADDPRVPDKWSDTENVAWKIDVPGRGWSSPVVWGDHLFLTTAVSAGKEEDAKKGLYFGGNRSKPSPHEHRWLVVSIDAQSGAVRWEREVAKGKPETGLHIKNSYASETPVTDGERVYAYFGARVLSVHELDGKKAWERRFEPVKMRYDWGTAASPVLHGERIYIVNDNEDASWLLALDRRTGAEVWRVERDEKSNWATPFIWETAARTEIVTPGSVKTRSYGLDGKVLWELRGMSSIAIPTPFAAHGMVFISTGYVGDPLRPIYAIKEGAAGDITLAEDASSSERIAWCDRTAAPYNPSNLVYGDELYTLFDRGFFTCHDARTGGERYGKQRIRTDAVAFTASPWAANGKIFCLSEDGDTYVIRAGKEFELLGVNSLGEMCMATPAIAGGRLYVRTLTKLYAIGAAAAPKKP